MLLLSSWIVSSGQSLPDTICLSKEEAQIVTVTLIEGETCCANLEISEEQIHDLFKVIEHKDSTIHDLRHVLTIKDEVINLRVDDMEALKSDVTYWKRRSTVTIILASIITGFTLFIAIK
jgi:hypothetical protein